MIRRSKKRQTGDGVRSGLPRSWAAFLLLMLFLLAVASPLAAGQLLVPMDRVQTNHLRAYGLAYQLLKDGGSCRWLLNYRGGSFLLPDLPSVRDQALQAGVVLQAVTDGEREAIMRIIAEANMEEVILEKAPKIAVYTPGDADPWDDAVTMALTYAGIPFDKVYDPEILAGRLSDYDWLHLHHEDFTGQYGKFWSSYRNAPWYIKRVQKYLRAAAAAGYSSVREHKLAVARGIRAYVERGGFLFAMCSACDTLDIALAAGGVDIIPPEIDNTPLDPRAQEKLDYSQCLAFENFKLETNPHVYEFSDIDVPAERYTANPSFRGDFVLFEFSAKLDRSPTILTQNHEAGIKGFMGQTTAFMANRVKKNTIILGRVNEAEVKYIYGQFGEGNFTFYGGHDPEDFAHLVGEQPTNLDLHRQSPGFRLILNNILFPAVRKKKQKT